MVSLSIILPMENASPKIMDIADKFLMLAEQEKFLKPATIEAIKSDMKEFQDKIGEEKKEGESDDMPKAESGETVNSEVGKSLTKDSFARGALS